MPAKKTVAKKSTKKIAATKSTKKNTRSKSKAGDQEVTIDRRTKADRRDGTEKQAPKAERREKVQRRRQIDPTTCERDYSEAEVQFMNAMDEYKRTSGRMFPTCSEVLEVIRSLGYVQLTPSEMAVVRPEPVAKEVEGQEDYSDFNDDNAEVEEFAC